MAAGEEYHGMLYTCVRLLIQHFGWHPPAHSVTKAGILLAVLLVRLDFTKKHVLNAPAAMRRVQPVLTEIY